MPHPPSQHNKNLTEEGLPGEGADSAKTHEGGFTGAHLADMGRASTLG
jgi:hypothetical protein